MPSGPVSTGATVRRRNDRRAQARRSDGQWKLAGHHFVGDETRMAIPFGLLRQEFFDLKALDRPFRTRPRESLLKPFVRFWALLFQALFDEKKVSAHQDIRIVAGLGNGGR